MVGIVACPGRRFPANNMSIIEALRKSTEGKYALNDRTGYGIPDVKKSLCYTL